MYAGAGDEFRSNAEIQNAFFDENGTLKPAMAEALHEDVTTLLYPSPERALALNKIYREIVKAQSFAEGRVPLLSRAEAVYESLTPADLETRVAQPVMLVVHARDFGCSPCVALSTESADASLKAMIDGTGMAGPDGGRYQIDADGLIDESNYAVRTEGVYFPFPPRHTLPTRMIVPLGTPTAACSSLNRAEAAA